jgi:hypothetical protein
MILRLCVCSHNVCSFSGIDAALQWNNGRTYFFKKGKYWRFNDREFTIDRANPPFPRDASHWWFGCPKPVNGGLTVDQSLTRGSFKFATDEEEDSYGYVGDEDLDVESSDSQITSSNSV